MEVKQKNLGLHALLFSITASIALGGCGGGSSSPAPAPNPPVPIPEPPPPPPPPPAPEPPPPAPTGPQVLVMDSVVLPESAVRVRAAPQVTSAQLDVLTARLSEWRSGEVAALPLAGVALQVGVSRNVDALSSTEKLTQGLHWLRQSDGHYVAAISVQSPGASGLRLGVFVERIPDEALVSVYRSSDRASAIQFQGSEINAVLRLNKAADEGGDVAGTWWTPDLASDEATIEISVPSRGDATDVRVAIPRISHIYRSVPAPAVGDDGRFLSRSDGAGVCNLDASCGAFSQEANGVAQMSFVRANGNSYNCTGTLLNSWKGDYTPYLITANHCIATQAEASSIQTRWFYRAQYCGSSIPLSKTSVRYNGAQLLYATLSTDTAFMKLNDMPPAGVTYVGWDARGTSIPSQAYSLHHPLGSLLKYSEGSVNAFGSCTLGAGNSIGCADSTSGSWMHVFWSKGVTEAGSSGSGLFENGRLTGTLSGGNSQCGRADGSDYYGRFDLAFNNRIWNWLAK